MSDFVVESLREVCATYARGVDRRDVETFLRAFHPDATLTVERGDAPASSLRGHDDLAGVIERIARYDSTHHLLGQSSFDLGDDQASGETYCLASHRSSHEDRSTTTVTMYIRYLDDFRWADGRWALSARRVVVDWTDVRQHAAVAS